MSASTENLIEQIKLVEEALRIAEANGKPIAFMLNMKDELKQLQRKLATCNEALVEGKQLLKS